VPKPERQQNVLDLLKGLRGIEPLKQLFWSELNYQRVNEPLSRRGWTDSASKALADDPVLFAGGGENNDFHVIYGRLASDRLLLGHERPVVSRLLREHPYALFVMSNATQDRWHFLNVKYDQQGEKRRLFRRITVGPEERLRTASERISLLSLEAISPELFGIAPLTIQQHHDEAFDVEAVTKQFFADFSNIFMRVAGDIKERNRSLDQEAIEQESQTLLNRLLFLYFVQRKGWLNRQRDYLYTVFREHYAKDADGTSYYSQFLQRLFVKLSTEGEHLESLGDVPFLNGGLFDDELGQQSKETLRRTRMKVGNGLFRRVFDDLLERYNFTVREDTPLNQDVAIDPEMLGKIFESLVLQLEQSDTGGKTSRQLSLFEEEGEEEFLDLNEAEEILRQLRREDPAEYGRIAALRDGIRTAKASTHKGRFVFCEAAYPTQPDQKSYQQLFLVDENGAVVSKDVPKILGAIKCGPEMKGQQLPKDYNTAVMRVQRQFAEEVKHRQAERMHTLSLSHGQTYVLREMRVLFGATEGEDQKAMINVLEKAFRGPVTRAVNRELNLLRRNGVSSHPLLKNLARIYDQHNLREWIDRRSLHVTDRPVPKIVCSEALVE
jgi:hypothetical protein